MASKKELRKEIKKWKRKYKREKDKNQIWYGSATTDVALTGASNASEAMLIGRNCYDLQDAYQAINLRGPYARDVIIKVPGKDYTDG